MKVKVFNVGQGDCFLIEPSQDCVLNNKNLLIDIGPQKAKITNKLTEKSYNLLITHSHEDHMGGFPMLYRNKNIENLYLPYYLPEIMKISQYIKKNIAGGYSCFDWRKLKKISKVVLLSEGDKLCGHLNILNPPKDPRAYFFNYLNRDGDTPREIERALAILNDYGFELPFNEIINYESPVAEIVSSENQEYTSQAKKFVHNFFISLTSRLASQPRTAINYIANSHIELTSNQASIVFKYEHQNGDWLFTGDADQSVFDRIIRNSYNNLAAKYLKIPHHGARSSLSTYILEEISPDVAIVSHGNRKFGRSNDPHPHYEVIDMLDNYGVRSYYSNPVIKKGEMIKYSTKNLVEGGCIEFI